MLDGGEDARADAVADDSTSAPPSGPPATASNDGAPVSLEALMARLAACHARLHVTNLVFEAQQQKPTTSTEGVSRAEVWRAAVRAAVEQVTPDAVKAAPLPPIAPAARPQTCAADSLGRNHVPARADSLGRLGKMAIEQKNRYVVSQVTLTVMMIVGQRSSSLSAGRFAWPPPLL